MTTTIKIVQRNEESSNALSWLFNSDNSPTACASYGSGNHCDNPERTTKKVNLWGKRGDEATEDTCALSRIIYEDDHSYPAALINIGFSGKTPTIMDKSNNVHDGNVYEFSAIFISEEYLENIISIAIAVNNIIHNCQVLPGYTKAFTTFNSDNPYQADLFSAMGAIQLTADNQEDVLGINSFHPERFQFDDNGQFLECRKWDSNAPQISHIGWHDSHLCTEWVQKTAFIFDIVGGHIIDHVDL